jgi:serine phosphatase RsbU (regulator of sigma subunit)
MSAEVGHGPKATEAVVDVSTFARAASSLPANDLPSIVLAAGKALGAGSARLLAADYAVLSLHELGAPHPTGTRIPIEGTLAGRAFIRDEIVVSDRPEATGSAVHPTTVWVPLTQDSERIGVLQLEFARWSGAMPAALDAIVRILTLVVLSKRRYTDVLLRSRRSERLSVAAEIQWDLLPPLSCVTEHVSIAGMLEPAYSIGGDSFDFALNPSHVEFAIVDAVGHGMPAVLKSVLAVNALRNARREGDPLEEAYLAAGEVLRSHFHDSSFVTGQLGALELTTGQLTWLNAGHPLPLLVRSGRFAGELRCRPSVPMGLGGKVREVATEDLQRGDRVLFYTDGVTETRSDAGESFGLPRLADYLVRATLEHVHPTETVRRLSASIVRYNGVGLSDDATLLLLEYHGEPQAAQGDHEA